MNSPGAALLGITALAVLGGGWLRTLNRPSGPLPFAVQTRVFIDRSRNEFGVIADKPGSPRELVVDFWHPLPASTKPPPIVLYSPGWAGSRKESVYLLEELASQGFIVAAVDHPYGSGTTVFPDGRRLRAPSHGYLSFTSAEELRATHAYVDQQLEIRIADIRFLVETLSKHDEANPFARTGNAFGIVGYSFGGTAAAALCSRGTRIQACVNIDGLLFDNLGSPNEVPWPFLHVISKAEPLAPGSRNQLPELEAMAQANTEALMTHAVDYSGSYVVSVSGARHDDFLDRPFFSLPVPNRAMQALTMYASDYLRTRLLNQPAPLLAKGAKPTHPSVFVQRREAPVP